MKMKIDWSKVDKGTVIYCNNITWKVNRIKRVGIFLDGIVDNMYIKVLYGDRIRGWLKQSCKLVKYE